MMKPTSKHVVRGALVLTIAGLISKVLSATYRIPLQNLTGDVGFYIYQQVYPFIGAAMILSLYGFPVAVSSLAVETKRSGRAFTLRHFFIPVFVVLFVINGAAFFIIFLGAPVFAQLSGEPTFTSLYRTVAFLFLFVPIIALLRGAFQGTGDMTQTAYSQMIEQVVRVIIIIGASYLVFSKELHVNDIGFAGIFASIAGFIVIIVYLLYQFFKSNIYEREKKLEDSIRWKYVFSTCMTLGIAASLNQLILIFIQFADVLTLVPNLIEHGFTMLEAREWKGIFDRGQPLIQFGVVFGSSFALALIPAITQHDYHLKQTNLRTIQDALSLSFYLASGATIGLICILPEANLLLFMDQKGTFSLQVLVVSILITSVAITCSAILLSRRQWKRILIAIVFMFFVKYLLNELLVPSFGITGSSVATILSLLVFLFIIFHKLKDVRFVRAVRWKAYMIATFGMTVYLLIMKTTIYPLLQLSRIGLLCYVLFIVVCGAFIYLILLLRYDAFSTRQISNLPLSSFLLTLKKYVKTIITWRKR